MDGSLEAESIGHCLTVRQRQRKKQKVGKKSAPLSTEKLLKNPMHINYMYIILKFRIHGFVEDLKFCICSKFSGSVSAACTRNRAEKEKNNT